MENEMRLFITGGSGLLGSKIATIALNKGYKPYSGYYKHKAVSGIPIKLDITKKNAVQELFERIKPEVVIHAAALSNVDKCEKDRDLARKVNIDGTRYITEASEQNNAFLVYVSTDYVFSGEKGMYKETDEPTPINHYGLTKLEAEKIVMASTTKWCIARPSVIYGSTPAARKINFALWVINQLKNKKAIKIITDQWVSPTLNTNLAEMILEIIEEKLTGIYHLAGATPINRYKFAKLIAETFELDEAGVCPSRSNEMNWLAKRPKNTSLNVEKASNILDNKPLKIKEAIKKFHEEMTMIR